MRAGACRRPCDPRGRAHSRSYDDWTAAGELRVGEGVSSASGEAVVVATNRVSEPDIVHNLWVGDSHRYRVSELELDVHNDCWLDKALGAMGKTRDDIQAWMRAHHPHGHHIIPKGMQNLLSARGRMVREMQKWAREHGIDVRNGAENLAVSPNGLGVHSEAGIRAVYDKLAASRESKESFVAALDDIRRQMWNGTFFDDLGTLSR